MQLSTRHLLASAALAIVILPAAANTLPPGVRKVPITNAQMAPDPAIALSSGEWVTLPGGTGTDWSADPAPGWTILGLDTGIAQPHDGMFSEPYPSTFAYIGGTTQSGSLTQQLGTVKGAATYTFTVNIGSRLDVTYGGYFIQFLADGVPIATFQDVDRTQVERGTFKPKSFSFSGAGHGGRSLSVVLSAVGAGWGVQVDYDKPRLTYVTMAAAAH